MQKLYTKTKYAILTVYAYIYSLSMFIPVFALPVVISQVTVTLPTSTTVEVSTLSTTTLASTTLIQSAINDDRAVKIDMYFAKNNLPLSGYGYAFVETADEYDLDWRLLPAIAMRESTGGKFGCPFGNHYNVFGWHSCKTKFISYEQAIDKVGAHLAGEVKSTASYYKDKTTIQKLKRYNSVIPNYTKEIFSIMNRIDSIEVVSR